MDLSYREVWALVHGLLVLIAVGLLGTFPPLFNLIGGGTALNAITIVGT